MINLNKRRIDFGKGDVGIGVIGNTTDSAQLAFYNQSARPIHIIKNREYPKVCVNLQTDVR